MTPKEIYDKQIALMESIDRLYDNEDFQKVILEGYFKDECTRTIRASTSCALTKEQREDCLHMAQATGFLQQYLLNTHTQGEIAKNNLAEYLQGNFD